MTKAEYLEKLQEKLERFGQELQEEILEDYRQHFTEGENEGKTEEEIIEELGNIEEMIRELSEEELNENLNKNQGWKQEMKSGLNKIIVSLPEAGVELSDSLKKFAQVMTSGVQIYQTDSQDENQEISQSKNADRSGSEEYAESSEGCRSLVLDGEVADITVELSDDDRIHVEYKNDRREKNKKRHKFYHYEEDNVFYTGVKKEETYAGTEEDGENRDRGEKIKVTLFGRTIISYGNVNNFNSGDCDIALIVRVPRYMKRIEIKSKSGDVSISNISSSCLNVTSASGDLTLSSVTADKLEVKMASGDVDIVEGQMREGEITTTSGDISGKGISIDRGSFSAGSGDIDLDGAKVLTGSFNTGSGDIELNNGYFRKIGCHTGSGDIDLHTTADEYECNAGSGDISISAETEPKYVGMHTGSGDVDLDLKNAEGLEVTVGTTGGDVDINWKGEQRREVKRGTYTFGSGSCKVTAKSGSGDIQVRAR